MPSHDVIEEAKRLGVPFRIIPREAHARKFKDSTSHIYLEQDEITYANPDIFLKDVSSHSGPVVALLTAFTILKTSEIL